MRQISFAVPLAMMVLSGIQLVRLFQNDFFAGKGKPFGQLQTSQGDVKRRPSDRFRWFNTQANDTVYEGESIRTAHDSSARIDIGQFGSFSLGEQSLVVLSRSPGPNGRPRIEIKKGRIGLKKIQNAEIVVQDKVMVVTDKTPAAGTVTVRQQSTIVQMEKGALLVNNETINKRWMSNSVLPTPLQASNAPTQPRAPTTTSSRSFKKLGDFEVTPSLAGASKGSSKLGATGEVRSLDVALEWKPLDGVREYTVEFFKRTDSTPYQKVKTTGPSHVFKIKHSRQLGTQYRILAALPSGKEAKSDRIPIQIEWSPPRPVTPKEGYSLLHGSDALFTWEKTLLADAYEFQMSKDKAFKSILSTQQSTHNFVSMPMEHEGALVWRVRSIAGTQKSPWSQPSSFKIVRTNR